MEYISPLSHRFLQSADPRRLVILGSTGSIGASTLAVVRRHREQFQILALAGARNLTRLAEQATEFRPPFLGILRAEDSAPLRALLPEDYHPHLVFGPEGYVQLARLPEATHVVAAQVGAAGLLPALAAAQSGKVLALATKEALVLAGHLFRQACHASGAVLLPVDSEHNAIFQAVQGHGLTQVRRLILTASGGPFRTASAAELAAVTPEAALRHPNWSMGPKITVDSATLMNKGLEFLEAMALFGAQPEEIAVLVHPQSVVHSLVEMIDGSLLAQLGPASMEVPIAHCLGYPERLAQNLPVDLTAKPLTFEAPDLERFPCLRLAMEAARHGPSARIALNAAAEVAVEAFLARRIPFLAIPRLIAATMETTEAQPAATVEDILHQDQLARAKAARILETLA
ncbi:1-deoxy-D-xylulose 5-phosphate reductoisomerase [Thermodesulfomicrobium sp. WS]|uniref:1-deoxy-D-xylulose-5-phosphate reductoisomerase n=1 Tax=Thermodesulfomicrobium sp. WS TaxID=3004129 RepID=UPI002492E19C|nr:1-deoxy-D-xylulose-5-phosphate reductoisomerase [Thermodesulfomicrobium sp. WS]BDV00311.1 1-deoxy-D-xylulose 5-phosphate reductoisomerase [Thermodesulfomicrobium sp. WS]